MTPQQLRKCHILPKNEALSNSTIVSKNWYSSLYLHTFSLVWSGEGLCDSYLETFEEMLKPLSVDTNYLECGHKLGSNSSLFGGWIYISDCSLTLKLRGWWSKILSSMFTFCLYWWRLWTGTTRRQFDNSFWPRWPFLELFGAPLVYSSSSLVIWQIFIIVFILYHNLWGTSSCKCAV